MLTGDAIVSVLYNGGSYAARLEDLADDGKPFEVWYGAGWRPTRCVRGPSPREVFELTARVGRGGGLVRVKTTVDHVLLRSDGGKGVLWNLLPGEHLAFQPEGTTTIPYLRVDTVVPLPGGPVAVYDLEPTGTECRFVANGFTVLSG